MKKTRQNIKTPDNECRLETGALLILTANDVRTYCLRALRSRVAVVLLIVTYLLSGASHHCFDMNVPAPESRIVLSMTSAHMDSDSPGVLADHHCHGCFQVSLPDPPLFSVAIEHQTAAVPRAMTQASDLVPGIDTPPPKLLG
ncbi:hypothetical protein [Nitrobacter winogradskyi]|uniref:Uncharacterized protein n=1 Tax=Nitrobacter winogradskyi TaxID=913 RepID=A0ACC6AGU8_NITWI|nr:hypothetical protein [Nitrobacter winogradskyi]